MRDLLSVNFRRVKNLFRMDLHRMIHGKAFWVMACIAVFIPVMMLTQMSDVKDIMTFVGSNGKNAAGAFGAGMNLSVLTILTGILLCITIGREYTSGYIKNIITSHANKCDYIISKTMIAIIWNIVFVIIYLITLFVLGAVMGLPTGITSVLGLVLYVIEKLLLSIPMSILMIAINLIFRRSYGWSIMFVCIAGTGMFTMSLQMILQMIGLGAVSNIFNFTITGAAAYATTTPSLISFIIIILVSVIWTLICTLLGNLLMNKRDVL